jgi:fluoride exporter
MEFAKTVGVPATDDSCGAFRLGRFFCGCHGAVRLRGYTHEHLTIMKIFWGIAIGGALGCLCRYYLGTAVQQRFGPAFPVGTLLVNVAGSFLIGLIMRYALSSNAIDAPMRLILTSGFCGGFTTFSTFSYETAILLKDGEYTRAASYIVASVTVALVVTFLGFATAGRILALPETT